MATQTIRVYSLGRFNEKLEAINRKAKKFGLPEVSVVGEPEIVWQEGKDIWGETMRVFDHYAVVVDYSPITLPGGWRLVAALDHKEGLSNVVPGETMPVVYRNRGPVCDHCHTHRDRNETFVVRSEYGVYSQVGRQCVGLYLGIDPAAVLRQVEVVRDLGELDEEERGRGGSRDELWELEYFLAHSVALVRTAGWRSRTAARDGGGEATADLVVENIHDQQGRVKGRYGEKLWIDPSAEDGALGRKVAAWLRGLEVGEQTTEYIANLAAIGRNDFVTAKSSGYAASAVVAYQKEQERELQRTAKAAANAEKKHLGAVGEKVRGTFTLVRSNGFDSQWGYTFFHRFVDAEGNVLVWKTGTELDLGEKYALEGKVTKLDVWNGEPQTVVSRPKWHKVEEKESVHG